MTQLRPRETPSAKIQSRAGRKRGRSRPHTWSSQLRARSPVAHRAARKSGWRGSTDAVGCRVESVRANHDHRNQTSGVYQADHDPQIGAQPRLWGYFYLPDARARWRHWRGHRSTRVGTWLWRRAVVSISCRTDQPARRVRPVRAQLAATRAAMDPHHYHLVQGAAQQLPFTDNVFDLAFVTTAGLAGHPPGWPSRRQRGCCGPAVVWHSIPQAPGCTPAMRPTVWVATPRGSSPDQRGRGGIGVG